MKIRDLHAVLAWLILNLISIPQTRFLKRRLIEQFNRDIEVEKKIAKSEIAQQVRHNLRTPLAALSRLKVYRRFSIGTFLKARVRGLASDFRTRKLVLSPGMVLFQRNQHSESVRP